MSNTIKATSELLIDCADNGNRQITAQTLRNVVVSVYNKLDIPNLGSITIDSNGNITATSYSGSGSSLTGLNATQLTSGSVPTARLTSIPAGNLIGSIADARLSANVALKNANNDFSVGQSVTGNIQASGNITTTGGQFIGNGNSITNIPAGNITGSTITIGPVQINSGAATGFTSMDVSGSIHGGSFTGDGSGLSNVTAMLPSDGTFNSLSVSGSLSAGSLSVNGNNMASENFVTSQGYLTSVPSDLNLNSVTASTNVSVGNNYVNYSQGLYISSGTTTLDNGEISTNGEGSISCSGNVSASSINSGTTITSGVSGSSNGLIRVANADGGYPIEIDGGSSTIKIKDTGNTAVITLENSGNISATSFIGDGSNLTGIYLLQTDAASPGQPYSASSLTTLAAAMRINVGGTDYFIPLYTS